jgi:hypothetical protein
MSRRLIAAALCGGLFVTAAGCESSQDRSARLQQEGAKLIANQHGLVIRASNSAVRVVQAGIVTDANGTAAAVLLRNTKPTALGQVPIAIDVLGAGHKTVFANSAPGLEASLTSVAALPGKGDMTWVDDQVIPTGKALSVHARVGAGGEGAPSTLPKIGVGAPKLHNDATSGLEAVGKLTNQSAVAQVRLFVYVSAWHGGRLISAGRGAVQLLRPHGHATYHVFLIGNPQGAQLTATAPPTVLR